MKKENTKRNHDCEEHAVPYESDGAHRGKDWRLEEWKEWAKKSRFPFNEPWEKAADMAHDGYTFKEAIKYINRSFPGMTTRDTVKARKEFG